MSSASPTTPNRRLVLAGPMATILLVVATLLSLGHQVGGLRRPDGTYVYCASSPEMVALARNNLITGGSNTLRFVGEKMACSKQPDKRFRTYDGSCNTNADRGAAFSVVKRFMAPQYSSANGGARLWNARGNRLPGARHVSKEVHKPKVPSDTTMTLLMMQIGQLLDHDMSIVPLATEFDKTIKCCGVPENQRYVDCMPIEVPTDDPQFHDCMEFLRSDPVTFPNGTVPNPRSHVNAVTSFLDGSMIYGSDHEKASNLRSLNGTGALLATSIFKGQERLPRGKPESCINVQNDHYCALAGDERVNEQPGLTAIHTVFHLEHNRLVRELAKAHLYRSHQPYSPYYVEYFLQNGPPNVLEKMYQVVRKVMGAVWQNIVYSEYLPQILGNDVMTQFHLWPGSLATYDPSIDPSIAMETLSAAFRFGHTLVNDMMTTDTKRFLKELFGVSMHNLENFNNIVKFLVHFESHSETYDNAIAEAIHDHLFENNKEGKPGLDLASLNIQRGRDHGIPGYNDVRQFMGLRRYTKWEEFGTVCGPILRSLYESVDDVDLFPGGTCEPSVKGGVVGETFAQIIGRQFADLKFGDRYFYETDDPNYGFKPDELYSLRKLKINKILCEQGALPWIQYNPFKFPDYYTNPYYRCIDLPDINMWYFTNYM